MSRAAVDAAVGGVRVLPVAAARDVAAGTRWIEFERPPGVPVDPGQFFMISAGEPSAALFLGRPFSIGDERGDAWCFLLRALGRGTAWLAALAPGAPLRIVGPLGTGFQIRGAAVHRLVAGGIGLAPFFHLARRIRAARPAAEIELWYGERTAAAHVVLDAGEIALFDRIERFTDDGSLGARGTVVAGLDGRWSEPGVAWYACGPQPMLRALALRLEEHGTAGAQFSLEERMACGFGVCQACVAPRRHAPPRWLLLCTEGPVVDPRRIAW